MKIFFYTLGCKVNQYESEAAGEVLLKRGHNLVNNINDADIAIVNSCTVTAESDRKTRQAVRRFKRSDPNRIVILMGCMPQAVPDTATLLPEADIVIGNTDHTALADLIDEFSDEKERIVRISPHERDEVYCTPSIENFSERTRAFMKIEDGCDRWCTYCIIPRARGVIRSRSLSDITAEANALSKNGFREIVLVGINLTSYGKDTGHDICDAVKAAAVEGIERIRLGSIEPDHMSDDLLDRLAAEEKFCPQFHLALQSGCDKTLKRMNRHYDTAFFDDLVKRIRAKFENASITTDIMVGFAGETEEDFNESVAFLRRIGFARSHVFAYSKRSGTIAAALPNQVEEAEKSRRAGVMAEAAADCEREFLKTQVGKTEKVLFEQESDGYFEGYTENYTRVKVKADINITGQILKVNLFEAKDDFCLGEVGNGLCAVLHKMQ